MIVMSDPTERPAIADARGGRWHAVASGVAFGAVVMTAGTFAPWLASGTNDRNLYSSAGVVQRLAGLGRPVGMALSALPFTGLYCLAAGVAYVMGRRRIAAGAIALLACVFTGVALAVLAHRRSGQIQLLVIGPSVTLIGALTCLVALLVAAGRLRRDVRIRHRTTRSLPAPPTSIEPRTDPYPGRPRTMELR
jgi:hypothetical protein